MPDKTSLFTDAAVEAGRRLGELRKALAKQVPVPFMQRRVPVPRPPANSVPGGIPPWL